MCGSLSLEVNTKVQPGTSAKESAAGSYSMLPTNERIDNIAIMVLSWLKSWFVKIKSDTSQSEKVPGKQGTNSSPLICYSQSVYLFRSLLHSHHFNSGKEQSYQIFLNPVKHFKYRMQTPSSEKSLIFFQVLPFYPFCLLLALHSIDSDDTYPIPLCPSSYKIWILSIILYRKQLWAIKSRQGFPPISI